MVGQFTSELDRQLKAEELREELRKAGDIGLEDMEKTVRGALDEAKKYEHMILPDSETRKPQPAPATRKPASDDGNDQPSTASSEPSPQGDSSNHQTSGKTSSSQTTERPSDNRS